MGLYRDSHAGDQRLANKVDALIMRAGRYDNPVNAIAERRQFIMDVARCRSCGTSGKECDRIRETRRDGVVGCCISDYLQACHHVEDRAMVDTLMREIMAGNVRTVAEAYPPPVQGPKLPGYNWLIWQNTWWYPHRRPAVRITEMDKPWRYNTANFLERRAAGIMREQEMRMTLGPQPGGDMACDAFECELDEMREQPVEYLRSTPLMVALRKGLPPSDSAKGRALAVRAVHWNTCPMRLAHPGARDRCVCVRDGGRIVGATNDPTTLGATA